MTTEAEPFPAPITYVQVGIPGVPYSAIRIPLGNNAEDMQGWADWAAAAAIQVRDAMHLAFPELAQEDVPTRQAAGPPQAQRPQQGQTPTRAEKYARVEGECDVCHGPIGRYPRTGNMRSDKAVCLGKCRDGNFVHTVRWLDDE